MFCYNCAAALSDGTTYCPKCSVHLPTPSSSSHEPTSDATGGIIPYKNAPALIGYYCGVFSLIPFFGLPVGLAAIPLGIAGLRRRRKFPAVRGTVHAWVAIVLGTLTTLIWGGILLISITAFLTAN
jgi:hypothetical protein